ncbi:hypothetical protein K439DRAFT_1663964 [Ramaria rubella]|nr:hypothetical protein K439DRAFT_1663964 [Ramaria rubella]
MGPSLAAREPRRSSRRPTHTPASRSSVSPSSAHHFPAQPDLHSPPTLARIVPTPALKRPNITSKRVKQEHDDTAPHPTPKSHMEDATMPTTNGRAKRKPKDKVEVVLPAKTAPDPPPQDVVMPDAHDDDDDDGGITRCVCGRTELDVDEEDPGLMVMCETCKVWQHGICVNLSEDAQDQDYYCEQCRPDLHVDLLKSLKKRARHPSHNTQSATRRHSTSVPRSSRSHSPGHVLSAANAVKAPKRRNTMNSRDAAYEDALKQLIESTRPEAEKDPDVHTDKEEHTQQEEAGVIIEIVSGARKKRKRNTADKENPGSLNSERLDMSNPSKRNRSNSSTPDRPIASTLPQRDFPQVNGTAVNGNGTGSRHASTSSGAGTKQNAVAGPSKPKRSRKDASASADTTDANSSKKHPNQYTYRKTIAPTPPRRPATNNAPAPNGHTAGPSGMHEHGTRRNAHAPHPHPPAPPQPLLTSWNLPDYLAHLAPVLPTDVPRPVEVRVFEALADGPAETTSSHPPGEDKVLERGVKVKWPAKRTSVGDMNKRVRGIIDWVGREQAVALERRRRREALKRALKAQTQPDDTDGENRNEDESPLETGTTHMMEEVMKELIAFQEKFGPGAKGKERERRAAG